MIESGAEQDACYRTIIVRARALFTTREESGGFCARVGTKWRKWCADVLFPSRGAHGDLLQMNDPAEKTRETSAPRNR